MKKFLLALAISGIYGLSMVGSPLTPQAALERAMGNAPAKLKGAKALTPELKFTTYSKSNATIYMFSRGTNAGFLAVSADDATTALLGYSTSGTLPASMAELPDGMRYWLQSLSEQVEYNAGLPEVATRNNLKRAATQDWDQIMPMIETRWNQDAPFNDLCPKIGTSTCYTGCVATAMAQVMKYYEWPSKGSGSHSYDWDYLQNGYYQTKTLSLDYDTITYDWGNMIDVYDSSATEAQKKAVAELMYSCGVAVDMDYGTSGSGAVSFDMVRAFIENFDYNKGVRFLVRDYYGIKEWNEIVYNNLKDYGPVLYGGQSNDGGHQFVCDGYLDGYFHFNWGWGGMSDGYFLLTALDPESQGIGGSTSGYNFSQDILTHLTSSKENDTPWEQVLWSGDFTIKTDTVNLGGKVTYTGDFYNYSYSRITSGSIGLQIVPADGSSPLFLASKDITGLSSGSGMHVTWNVTLPDSLAAGRYTVLPAMINSNGDVVKVPVAITNRGSYNMIVSDNQAIFTAVAPASILAEDLKLNNDLYIGQAFKVTATLINLSPTEEYYGDVLVGLEKDGSLVAVGDKMSLDMMPNESLEWQYLSTLSANGSSTLTAGTYDMYLYEVVNGTVKQIAGPLSVELHAASTPTLKISDLTIEDNQPLNNIKATATLECTSGYFAGTLTLYIFPAKGGRSLASYDSNFIILSAEENEAETMKRMATGSTPVSFTCDFSNAEPNSEYEAGVYHNGSWISNFAVFNTGLETSMENVESDQVVGREYYSLTGVSLGSQKPRAGVYIVKEQHSDGHITAHRLLLK